MKRKSIIDWVANDRMGRFFGLVIITDVLLLPMLYFGEQVYYGCIVGNLCISLWDALTMKIY